MPHSGISSTPTSKCFPCEMQPMLYSRPKGMGACVGPIWMHCRLGTSSIGQDFSLGCGLFSLDRGGGVYLGCLLELWWEH